MADVVKADVVKDFVSTPRRDLVDAARDRGLRGTPQQSALESEEIAWERANPMGQADVPEENELILWNFGVARSELKGEHVAQLRRFLGFLGSFAKAWDGSFTVIGHASHSGSSQENEELAEERALSVMRALKEFGFRNVYSENRGASEPRDYGTNGMALARNRRVEIRKSGPTPSAGPDVAPRFVIPGSEREWNEVPGEANNGVAAGVVFKSPWESPDIPLVENGELVVTVQ